MQENHLDENQNQASPAKNDDQIQTKAPVEIDAKRKAKIQLEHLTSVLDVSPLKFQVTYNFTFRLSLFISHCTSAK